MPQEQLQQDFGDFIKMFAHMVAEELYTLQRNESRPDDDTLIPQKEAARMLDTSVQTLIRWNQEGKINAKRIGRKVFYSKNEMMNR